MRPIFIIKVLIYFVVSYSINNTFCQTATTISASCGKCGKSVSPSSRTGDTCPYCGVRWGGENTSVSNSKRRSLKSYVSESSSTGYSGSMFESSMTVRVCRLMSSPSSKSVVLCLAEKGQDLYVTSKKNGWVKVNYHGIDYNKKIIQNRERREYDMEYSQYEMDILSGKFAIAPTKPFMETLIPQNWVGWLRVSDVVE